MTLHLLESMDYANGSQLSSEFRNSATKFKHEPKLCRIEVGKRK